MESYALDRAESKIRHLEFELQRLRHDVEHLVQTETYRFRVLEHFVSPMLWIAACCILGAGLGTIIGKTIKMFVA